MATQVAQITKEGDFKVNGIIRDTAASINSSLVHDFDFLSSHGADQHVSNAMAIPNETAMRAHNLLDAFGIDWRDPSNWSGGDSDITYNAREDCLVIKNVKSIVLNIGIPILHDLKFNISIDAWQSNINNDANKPILYFGGKIYDAESNGNLLNEQIPGTYDYFCVSGKRPSTTSWTTFKNDHGGGNPRTGIDGVKSSSAGWVSNAARYYRPTMLANYSGETGDELKVRNIRFWYSDDDNTERNPNIGAGFRINSAGLKNWATKSNLGTSGATGGWYGVSAPKQPCYLPDGSLGTKFTLVQDRENSDFLNPSRGNGTKMGGVSMGTWATVPSSENPAGKWYTAAMLIRCSDWSKLHSNQMYFNWENKSDGTRSSRGAFSVSRKHHVGDGWYLCYAEHQMSDNVKDFYIGTYNYHLNHEVEMGAMTLVNGRLATLLKSNQVTQDDELTIKTRSLKEYTIIGKFINSKPIGDGISYTDGQANQAILFSLQAQDGKWVHLRRYNGSNGDSVPFIDPDNGSRWNISSTSSNHRHTALTIATGQEIYWVAKTRPNEPLYVQFYGADGSLYSNFNNVPVSVMNDPSLEAIALGLGSNNWQGIHSQLMVYSTYLNNPDITHLIKTRMNVDNGETREFISEHRHETNLRPVDMTRYEKARCDSGWASFRPITNLLPDNDPSTGWSLGTAGSGTIVETPYKLGVRISGQDSARDQTSNTTSGHYRYRDIPSSNFKAGDKICFSAWCYMSKDWTGDSHMLRFERYATTWAHYDTTKKGTWQLIKLNHTVTASNLATSAIRCLTYNSLNKYTKGHIIIADLRVCKVDMPTLTTPTGMQAWDYKMRFNLYRDYKIDFRENWTFAYWKKPISSHTGGDGGYVIDSLGYSGGKRTDNTTSGYVWWGKTNGKNEIYSTGAIADMNTYWNKWRLIVVSHKKGDGLYVTEVDAANTYHRKLAGTGGRADYWTATKTHDADMQLGGWQTNDRCTAIYRDIKCGQTYYDQASIEKMFKEGLRLTDDGIMINGELIEGGV